ncbi:MAG: hypothetical protein KTR31_07850 [Myxococcales bacterium]|nr:hypothetical protein [Myxococcales bacterium]
MLAIALALGCGAAVDVDGQNVVADGPPGGDDTPRVTLEDPAAGAFLPEGTRDVTGVAWRVSDVTVSGEPAQVTAGSYAASLPLVQGLNVLEVTGVTDAGDVLSDAGAVLAGDFVTAQGPRPRALQLHLSADGLGALTVLAGDFFSPASLTKQLEALNPVIDDGDTTVIIEDVRFGKPAIQLVPIDGALLLTVVIPDVVIGVEAEVEDALPFGIDLTLSPDIEADELLLVAELALSTDGQGGLQATLGELTMELSGFDLDTGLLELVDWIFLDDDDLADTLEEQLEGAAGSLQPTIDEALANLDLSTELDLLGSTMLLEPAFDDVVIDSRGLSMALSINLDVVGPEPEVPGHLTVAPPLPDSGGDVLLQLSDDFMNRLLFEVWAGGALDLEIEMDAPVRVLFGAAAEGTLALSPQLPPVWIDKEGGSRMQLGEVILDVDTPGGTYGDSYQVIMAIDAAATLRLSNTSFGVVLSDAQIHMRPGPQSADNAVLIESIPTLANTFGVGIGIINGLLSFDLSGTLGKGVELSDIEVRRDSSGRGTALALTSDDLLVLLGQEPPPPTFPKGLAVPVPASATVYDSDVEEPADGAEGWICDRDDVDATGNDGTWYLEDGAEMRIFGTGHVVYAADGSGVEIASSGNVVYAAPGANIRDQNGDNWILVTDPLTLDLTNAPAPGCP